MVNIVIKRDGREDIFNSDKVKTAISRAFVEIDGAVTDESNIVIDRIANEISKTNKKKMFVEEIQDIVETKLMASNRKDVAKAYILYRNERTKVRDRNSKLIKAVSEKLMASNVQNQNANVDEKSFGGRMGEANDAVMKQYALDRFLNAQESRRCMFHGGSKIPCLS